MGSGIIIFWQKIITIWSKISVQYELSPKAAHTCDKNDADKNDWW